MNLKADILPITRKEWRFVWLTAGAVLLLTSLPYLFGYLTSPTDKQFMGLMQDVPDHGQYLSWWRGFQSSFLLANKLTPEPNQPLFFNLLWWLLAQISMLTGLGYAVVYQILRWGAGLALMAAVYRLAAVIFSDIPRRRTAFLLVVLSSGLGWMLVIAKYVQGSSDLVYPLLVFNSESNYFLCLLGYPHFALAAALIALVLEYVLRAWKTDSIRLMVIAGLWALVLGWMHAYDLIILYAVAGCFFLLVWITRRKFPRRFFWGVVALGLISFIPAVYSYLLTSLDPMWKEVLSQFSNAGIYTPLPPFLFFLLGVPLFLAVAALVVWFREKKWSDERLFVASWFMVGFLLLYIPTDYQIHMLNSWQIPVMFLATAMLYDTLIPAIERTFRRPLLGLKASQWAAAALLLLVLPTNLYLWSWRFVELARHDYPYYLEKDYLTAMDWLRQNSQPQEIVLSSLMVGQYIPAISGNSVFLGHWAHTVNFYNKEEQVSAFFDPAAPDTQRVRTASTFKVDYVVYGPAERALGTYSPGGLGWLKPVYQAGAVTVYQVSKEQLAKAPAQ